MLDDFDLAGIPDEPTRTLIVRLLNLIEAQAADLREAQVEAQRLRDENNRLKGEQGTPDIKPPARPPAHSSSEPERHRRAARGKRGRPAAFG